MGSAFGAFWEDPEGGFYQIRSKKSFKTRPNTPYGGGTSHYSLLQGGVCDVSKPFILPLDTHAITYKYIIFCVSYCITSFLATILT